MPAYEHARNAAALVEARAAQDDPSVMYLVVRKAHEASLEGFAVAAVQATREVTRRYRHDPRYADAFAYWLERSFRKVCLRANEKEWAALGAFDAGDGYADGQRVVRALPPRRKSEREKLLVQLQAYTAAPEELPSRAVAVPDDAPVMALVANGDVPMRCGKLAAQLGHAALLAREVFDARAPEAMAAWEAAGAPCVVLRAAGEAWAALKRDALCALVRDAGLTEVAQGSETCVAVVPTVPGAWLGVVRGLPRV